MNIYKTSNKTLILPVTYSNKLTSLTIIRQEVLQYLQDMIEIYKQKESQEEGKSLIEVSFWEEFIDSLIDKTKDSKQYIDYIKEEPLSLSLKDGNVKSERNIIDYIDREYEQTFKQLNGLLNDDEHYKFPQKDMNNFNIPSLYENKSLLSFIDVISIFIGHWATQLPYMPYRNNELLCLWLGLYWWFKLKDYNPSDTSSKTHFREYYQIWLKNEEIT
jgi:hypothetical protein